MKIFRKTALTLFWFGLTCSLGSLLVATSAYLYLSPKLPPVESYQQVRLENPLRIFTSDGQLIAEFGDKKRDPIRYQEVPPLLVSALLASEDKRFYNHNGVSIISLGRSVAGILTGDTSSGGGSTLTMQVAKNISFAGEDPYSRKFKEILLALQVEKELDKETIIELYFNLSFFGISAYGISAATQQYYDKEPKDLSLAEMAMMVGILPSPNSLNPLRSPERALVRRNSVLRRMLDQGMISQSEFDYADASPITASRYGREPEVDAPYIAEMVRQEMVERFGSNATRDGISAYTTIHSDMQEAATSALREGLETYDRRHGYRGRENHLSPEVDNSRERWLEILNRTSTIAGQIPAFVEAVEERSITAVLETGESIQIDWEGIRWAKRFITVDAWGSSPRSAHEVVNVGDLIRVTQNEGQWEFSQVPMANGGLVSIDPNNGRILALVGGYDYYASKFNRVTQAERQPGSNFKPFLYSAALENGYTSASLINDAPLPREDYRPENFNRQFLGPIRLKYALTTSKNLVSLRLYEALGEDVVFPYIDRFGFDSTEFPGNDLSIAIGTHALTPIEVATGYTVFANGGYAIEPYLIERIESFNDGIIFNAVPAVVCDPCDLSAQEETETIISDSTDEQSLVDIADRAETAPPLFEEEDQERSSELFTPAERVIDERTAYIMNTILRSVITEGSGRPANRAIDRNDIAGKTGTTNDAMDLWFSGFNGDVTTTVYVGLDQHGSLGRSEQGSTVALPIWIDFMQEALKGAPEHLMAQPNGLTTVRINRETGLRARPDEQGAIFEIFKEENVPAYQTQAESPTRSDEGPDNTDPEHIF